jgi:hypothetical protein
LVLIRVDGLEDLCEIRDTLWILDTISKLLLAQLAITVLVEVKELINEISHITILQLGGNVGDNCLLELILS